MCYFCVCNTENPIVLDVPEGFNIQRNEVVYEAYFCSEDCKKSWEDCRS